MTAAPATSAQEAPLLEREAALELLARELDDALGGRGRLVFVEG